MAVDWNWVLIIAGAALILVEVGLGGFAGFDMVLIGSAFVVGGALGLALSSTPIGFSIATVLCIAYIAAGRRMVRARMKNKGVPSNTDALIEQRARVISRVADHEAGQVKVKDETWRALPAPGVAGPFEPGAVVTVQAVDGVTLYVR